MRKCIESPSTPPSVFPRLWDGEKNRKREKQNRKENRKKGKKKGEKAPATTSSKLRLLIKRMTRDSSETNLPTDRLFELFQTSILTVLAGLGLLGDIGKLNVASDGTPVATIAYARSKPSCECHAQGLAKCNHPRIYSQPDCNSDWNSSKDGYFNGYHLYMLSPSDSKYDLPIYPKLQPASRHNSDSLVISSIAFRQRFTLGRIDKMLPTMPRPSMICLIHRGLSPSLISMCELRKTVKLIPTSRFRQTAYQYAHKG